MINFASLFGSFSRGGNSAINDLLQKRGTNLDQLLDVDTFPNEYKSGNAKIMEFMNYSKYQELIHYVTVEGSAEDQKKGFKFPMVAADILSSQNNAAIDFILPDGDIQVEVEYKQTQEIEIQVDDEDEPYLTEQSPKKQDTQPEESTQPKIEQENATPQKQEEAEKQQQNQKEQIQTKEPQPEVVKEKKKKIIKQQKVVVKTRKQKRQPLIGELLSYYEGPINYTLAGYNCKVLSMLFTKKPTNFLNFFFNSEKNYVEIVCSQVESKSVGDLITKILIWENSSFIEERKRLFNHLIDLMSQVKESHVISNLAYTLSQIIEKSSTYIKSKPNIANNQEIIQAFLSIFYRTSEVHKIINNAMDQNQNRSGYNCLVLHAYLHHTQIQTVNSFQIEEVLQSFITKAAAKLRIIPDRKTLGMGRVKIVEIFSFLIRKQRKTIEEDTRSNQMTSELIEELYVHTLVSKITDFFTILFKLVQSFENNNILHNEVFRIIDYLLKEPQENKSALQQLLLNQQNVLLNFIIAEAEKDKITKTPQKPTKRKGYIGHVINTCKLIDQINNNELLNQRIKKTLQFQQILNTLIAFDIIETNKSLAGYQMKKNPNHEIMFQKEDILSAYAGFLQHCPKPQFEPEEPQSSEDETPQPIMVESQTEKNKKPQQTLAEKQLSEEQRDEQKFNELAAVSAQVDESNPKFWITHINYDIDLLMQDVQ